MMRDETVIFAFDGPMGVRVEIGQSLVWLLGLLFWFNMDGDIVFAIMMPFLLMTAIFLHELGHAWGNLVQGVPVRRVMLYGGGGFCESGRSRSPYEDELIVAMGPIVNAALWAMCSLIYYWMPSYWFNAGQEPSYLQWEVLYYVQLFGWFNLLLLAFNLIPVQPLDGGKLFHLLLLRMMHPPTAHRVTGAVGLVFSVAWIPAMAVLFFTYGWVLFFIPSIAAHYRMTRGELAY